MERESADMDWNWDDPVECTRRLDGARADSAYCDKFDVVGIEPPFTRRQLRDLNLTGIEFAAFRSSHESGLAADYVPLRCAEDETCPHRIYRVDGETHFLRLDISEPLPFEDQCVDWVYAEHLIEHITLDRAIAWLREVRRILAPGGLLRLTTPDLGVYMNSYLDDDGFFDRHRERMLDALRPAPRMPTRPAFMVNQIFYLYGHRWIYDFDEVSYVLCAAGFASDRVRQCKFREGADPRVADLDRLIRNDETLYVEANA